MEVLAVRVFALAFFGSATPIQESVPPARFFLWTATARGWNAPVAKHWKKAWERLRVPPIAWPIGVPEGTRGIGISP